MCRSFSACRIVAFSPLILLLLLPSTRACAQQGQEAVLPVTDVVLFTAGVGFFNREAEIEGSVDVALEFQTQDVNDLLQSMVVQDFGGQVAAVGYPSLEPPEFTLETFRVNLAGEPTLADLLRKVRGEEIEVQLGEHSANVAGVILGVELQTKVDKSGQAYAASVLNLLTDEGLEAVPLDAVRKIKLVDPALDADLRKALAVIAAAGSTDKRTLTVSFTGEGKRAVRVGYIQEAPIWKTSYRLVIDDEEPPFLQGWAMVENATDDDWNDVSLSLVSGRPISFITDLYQSLYVQRPVVRPDLFASLQPQAHGQDLAGSQSPFVISVIPVGPRGRGFSGMGSGGAPGMGSFGGSVAERGAGEEEIDLEQGVESVAETAEVGELFEYRIGRPVDLPRGQSAMLPIVNATVGAARLSLFNIAVHGKHPLNALRLTNSTDLHLMQGPITVFDGGTYAGSARMLDLPPGEERLISYALDLDLEVDRETAQRPQVTTLVSIASGVLHARQKETRWYDYTVKSSSRRAKEVLVEHRKDPGWELVSPKPAETTRDLYRMAVQAGPGESVTLSVVEERESDQQVAIDPLKLEGVAAYLSMPAESDELKAALEEIFRRSAALEAVDRERRVILAEFEQIEAEQSRIRANMESLDRTAELYLRYVQKLQEQEDRIDELRPKIAGATQRAHDLRQDLGEYVLALDLPGGKGPREPESGPEGPDEPGEPEPGGNIP